MANCVMTNDVTADCDFLSGGVDANEVFVTNRANLATVTKAGTAGRIDGLTLNSGARWFKVDTSKGFTTYNEESAKNNGQKSVTQTIAIQTSDSSQETKNAYEEIALSADLMFVMRNNNGQRFLFGETVGLEATTVSRASGANTEDFAGFAASISGPNKGFADELEDTVVVDVTPFP